MENTNRIIYPDLLRTSAIFAAIIVHTAATNWSVVSVYSYEWMAFNFYDSIVRFCVPVLVMISGMFFLNPAKNLSLKQLYGKYIFRIITALFLWGVAYEVLLSVLQAGEFNFSFILNGFLIVLKGNARYHLWFLYMLIGLYMILPIIKAYVAGAKKLNLEYLLILSFFFASLFPVLIKLGGFDGLNNLLSTLQIHMVIGYSGYFVLGYYLHTYNPGLPARRVIYILSFISVLITIFGTAAISMNSGIADTTLYSYFSPNVLICSLGIFVFFRNYFGKKHFDERTQRIIRLTADYSFSIYLMHDMFLILFNRIGFSSLSFSPIISIPIIATIVFSLSFLITYLFRYVREKLHSAEWLG